MKYDLYAIGNALVDYEIEVEDSFFNTHGIEKSLMTLVDGNRQKELIEVVQGHIKEKQGGGSAANTAVALSKLGGKGFYSCKVANDEDGIVYLNDLNSNGLHTNLSSDNLPEGTTGKCLVMVTPDAERTMNTFLGITSDFSVKEIDESALSNAKYLFIEGYLVTSETGLEAMKVAKAKAQASGVKVSLTFSDPSMVKYFKEQMKEVVGDSVDLLFCNEEEALLFTDTESLSEACYVLKKAANQFVITLGNKGALVFDGSDFIDIEAFPTTAIDTNGAGDMFSGAFLFGITNGYSHAEAGKLASKAASDVVSQYGPRLSNEHMSRLKMEILGS